MSRLETFYLEFQSPRYPASRPPPPLTRSVLPALTFLVFCGVHEYLEASLAQVEAPLINKHHIVFFMDLDFVLPHLHRFIDHAEWFKTSSDRAIVRTSARAIQLSIFRGTNRFPEFSLEIRCRELDWQLALLAQVCSPSFPLLSRLVQLDITDGAPQSHWKDDMEITQWLELLAPFTAVKDLRLSHQAARHICQALEELAEEERVTEVLPALHNIFLSDLQLSESVPIYMEGFVARRTLSDHPVAVRRWG
ncbi:hypothetical protein F5148DRAFT_317610 [Russula earlei]|uniref:Uncharacterized protein n=1 Tax=Russula earlei TaxID=71964 RepID=A0ACC0U2U0_9AGAM|nr:hypothetical protein F5148DRAFT_317610 [Russula earlei]